MTDPHSPSDPQRRTGGGEQPGWYGGADGAGDSSGSGSSSAGWPDAAADPAQAPSYGAAVGQGHAQPGQDPQAWAAPGHDQNAVYGYGAPLQPGQSAGTGLSISSMILGILSVIGGFTLVIPPIVGVVLGHMGRRREPNGRGMAIAGLVMNYLSLAFLLATVALIILLVVLAGTAANELGTY